MARMIVNILTDPTDRGLNKACYGIAEDLKIVEITIIQNDETTPLASKLHKGKFVVLQQYSINDADGATYVRLTSGKTKIFQTGKTFDVPKDILQSFYNPPTCTVPEALASPKKRRLSIDGTVSEIYALRTGSNWQRRDIILEDPTTQKKICVKLWNKHANAISENSKGNLITLNNVEVDIFNNRHQLRSTDLTTISTTQDVKTTTGEYEIVGVDEEEDKITVITACCKEFTIAEATLQAAGLSVQNLATNPLQATLHIEDNVITKITKTTDQKTN